MVDPALIGLGIGGATLAAAAAYSFLTGEETSASVDVDGDGETDVSATFNEENEDFETVEKSEDPTPDYVTDNYNGLTDITGIGPTRAEDIGKAGLPDPVDVYYASDYTLLDVDGIGPRALEQIRGDIGGIDESGNGESDEEAADSSSSSDE